MAVDTLDRIVRDGMEAGGIKEISFVCMGGQGARTAAQILAKAAVREGKYVYQGLTVRGERRMTPVHNSIRIADRPPVPACDVHAPTEVMVFDEALYGANDGRIRESLQALRRGVLMVCTHKSPEEIQFPYDFEGTIATVDAASICIEVLRLNPPPFGTTALGLYAAACDTVSFDSLKKAMLETFRGRAGERNVQAAERAYKQAKVLKGVSIEGYREREGRVSNAIPLDLVPDAPSIAEHPPLPGISNGNVYIHTDFLPYVDKSKCTCTECQASWYCPEGVGKHTPYGYVVDYEYCKGCGICATECAMGAIEMRRTLEVYNSGRNG